MFILISDWLIAVKMIIKFSENNLGNVYHNNKIFTQIKLHLNVIL